VRPRTWRILVVAIAVATLVWLVADLSQPSVMGDGVGLYAPLASLLFDHDLDFRNEFEHSGGSILRAWLTMPDGRLVNPYPIGAAILWAPPVAATWLFDSKRATYGAPDRWRNSSAGFQRRYVLAVAAGTALEAVAAALLLFWLVRRFVQDPWVAALGVGAATLGTPLLYYALAMPSYAHTASFLGCTGLLAATLRGGQSRRFFVLLGALWGLVTLVRYQDGVLGVLAAPHLLRLMQRPRSAEAWLRLALFAAAALVVFLPQILYWQRVYGGPLVTSVPILMNWTRPQLLAFLFSTWQGALLWSPVIGLGIVGLRRFPDRAMRWAMWAAIALQIYVCAATGDFWGSASCGARRLVVIAPLVALGVALGLQHGFVFERRPGRRRLEMLRVAIVVVAIAWNVRLVQFYAAGLLPRNPGNPADYMRSLPIGHPFLKPWPRWDYGRFAAELLEAERTLLP
jgi:hypothetical protein